MDTTSAELKAWAYLNRVIEGTHPEMTSLIAQYGPVEVAERIQARRALSPSVARATETRAEVDCASADLEQAGQLGYRLIAPGMSEWPEELFAAFATLKVADRADAPPLALWVRGRSLRELTQEAVALVGTRAATRYGISAAQQLAQSLVGAGVTVISGGALGIDAAAHQAALSAGGSTIAVAAAGPGVVYPRRHGELFDHIAQTGAVVSEYPPGTPPARHRFLTRNRLVAALSQATVVVEAGWRSGARNTATWATRLGRPLGAVPGQISAPAASGCHDLIRSGQAVLVASAENIRALYRPVGDIDEDGQLALEWQQSPVQALSRNELAVYDALEEGVSQPAAQLAASAGLSVRLTTHLLLELLNRGLSARVAGGWRRVVTAE